jgi:hypothetical protein
MTFQTLAHCIFVLFLGLKNYKALPHLHELGLVGFDFLHLNHVSGSDQELFVHGAD